ncbi:MAG: orotate phosphoribosyltransferase [Bacteroidales bacterium]|nr:orotate phosphoribosyltransferase [Bacteroidales bacterium]
MKNINKLLAGRLLQCEAIKLSLDPPFQWSSGWKSPIYCDNRITLSYPGIRNLIKYNFVGLIKEKFLSTEAIAAVATGAIAHGALVADEMGLPFLYIRSEPKTHGLSNLIEGRIKEGQKVVVIEDLVSTGRSSINAVEALRSIGAKVMGMVAIFTYGFKKAEENFKNAGCLLYTLSNFDSLLETALETGYIEGDNLAILKRWMQDPENWVND